MVLLLSTTTAVLGLNVLVMLRASREAVSQLVAAWPRGTFATSSARAMRAVRVDLKVTSQSY